MVDAKIAVTKVAHCQQLNHLVNKVDLKLRKFGKASGSGDEA